MHLLVTNFANFSFLRYKQRSTDIQSDTISRKNISLFFSRRKEFLKNIRYLMQKRNIAFLNENKRKFQGIKYLLLREKNNELFTTLKKGKREREKKREFIAKEILFNDFKNERMKNVIRLEIISLPPRILLNLSNCKSSVQQ